MSCARSLSSSTTLCLAALALLTGCPEPVPVIDAGPGDDPIPDDEEDAGLVMVDSGILDCPTVTLFIIGDPCTQDGQICRSLTCIAPGESCLEIECRDGVWRNVLDDGDAGVVVDAGPGDAGPLRTVLAEPLFHELPVDNRVLDPLVTMSGGAGWTFLDPTWSSYAQVYRDIRVGHPRGAPALIIPSSENANGALALAAARGPAGPLEVEIFVGRTDGLSFPAVSFLGVFLDGTPGAYDLGASGDTTSAEGVTWRRFRAVVPEGPVGWAYLSIDATSHGDVYLAAPVVVPASDAAFAASVVVGSRRALSAREGQALSVARARDRDRLAAPRDEGPLGARAADVRAPATR